MAAITKARADTTVISAKIDDFAAIPVEGVELGLAVVLGEPLAAMVGVVLLVLAILELVLALPKMPPWTWAGALEPLCFEAAILYAPRDSEPLVLREGLV